MKLISLMHLVTDDYDWFFFSPLAEAWCCSLHAPRHNSGDGPELQSLQAQQETDT